MLDVIASTHSAAFAGWALAVTLLALLASWLVLRLRSRLRTAERELYCERMDRRQGEQLAPGPDAWLWQTDREHRLVRLQPPATAVRQTHAEQWLGQPVFELLRAQDGPSVLPAALQREADLPPMSCGWASGGGAAARPLLVRALAQHDMQGRFRGFLGVLQVDRASSQDPRAARGVGAVEPEAGATRAISTPPAMADAEIAAAEHASFTYTVTHDLRAPIRVVEGFTRIVKEDYGAALDRMGLDHLDRVLGAAARMNAMIDALLALSRLSQQPLARQPVNLSRLAEYIVDDLRRTHPDRQVRVTIEPGLTTEGDPTLLRMALENLLGNAWKYTGKVRDAQIGFQHDPAATGTVYLVRDNGAGFDMRFADRLFGVFQRLHSASEFPGTGVGLASVQRIVRRHGGEIWAESTVGKGTTFRFTLSPQSAGSAAADGAATALPMWGAQPAVAAPATQPPLASERTV